MRCFLWTLITLLLIGCHEGERIRSPADPASPPTMNENGTAEGTTPKKIRASEHDFCQEDFELILDGIHRMRLGEQGWSSEVGWQMGSFDLLPDSRQLLVMHMLEIGDLDLGPVFAYGSTIVFSDGHLMARYIQGLPPEIRPDFVLSNTGMYVRDEVFYLHLHVSPVLEKNGKVEVGKSVRQSMIKFWREDERIIINRE